MRRCVTLLFACLALLTCPSRGGPEEGLTYLTYGLSLDDEGDAWHAEALAETWTQPWLSGSAGFFLFASRETDVHVGLEARVRLASPTVISPFVGLGAFLGQWPYRDNADRDRIDNDDDGWVDEPNERTTRYDLLFGVYPEAGLRLWLHSRFCVAGHVRRVVTTRGEGSHTWLYGLSLTHVF